MLIRVVSDIYINFTYSLKLKSLKSELTLLHAG